MIYLDYNATTPVTPPVMERMLPYFTERFGNPSSGSHSYGWTAQAGVDAARESLGVLLGARPDDLVFTSGATESVNMAIKGVAASSQGGHIISVATEHKAVLDTLESVGRIGTRVTILPVDSKGHIDLNLLRKEIREDTALVAVMWANNETGTIAPIQEISSIVRSHGIPLLTDATQAVGKVPVSVEHVDMLACSAHKFYGPKGVGALWVRRGRGAVRLPRFIDGGGQQNGRRGGTLNVPSIVGMGAAADLAGDLADVARRLSQLRDDLEHKLLSLHPGAYANGDTSSRLPQTTSITFPGVKAANLMAELRALAVSNASACSSGSGRPSHVLKAMGLSDADAAATIRFSLGRPTTEGEILHAIELVQNALAVVGNAGKRTASHV